MLTQKTQGNFELVVTGTEMQSQGQAVSVKRNSPFFATCAVLEALVLTHTQAPCIHTAPAAIETPVDGLCRMNQPSRAVVPNFGCSLGSLRGLLENTIDRVPLRPIKSDSPGMGPSRWYL